MSQANDPKYWIRCAAETQEFLKEAEQYMETPEFCELPQGVRRAIIRSLRAFEDDVRDYKQFADECSE